MNRTIQSDKFLKEGCLGLSYLLYTILVIFSFGSWKPDIILPINRGWQGIVIRLYCLVSGSKMVVSGQAGYKDRMTVLTHPDGYISLTERNAAWYRNYAFGTRVRVIPNGADLKQFSSEGNKNRIPLKHPVVICVAGGEKYKRVDLTIDAVSQLGNACLLLVGGSKEQENYGKKTLGGLFLRMAVKHKEMPFLYRACDVFTLVSEETEAFATAMIEAAACGLPVVIPDDALRREIMGPYGFYVSAPENVDEYVAVLRKALVTKSITYNAQWLKKYSWDVIAKKYIRFFSLILRSDRPT